MQKKLPPMRHEVANARKWKYFCEFSMAKQTWFSKENSSLCCASCLVFTTKLPFFFLFFFFFFLSNQKMAKKKVKEKHQCVYPALPSPVAVKYAIWIFFVDRLGIEFEPMAIDHKCMCFIINCLEFDWAIVIYLCNFIWTKPMSCELGLELFEFWIKQ